MMINLKQLKADREAGTDGPWRYRPNSTDDWGTVCGPEQVDTIGTHICQARDPLVYRSEQLAEHRAAGTDPWEVNARRIARLPDLEAAYIEAVAKLDKAVEALGDSQATLASIRAATVGEDWGEQSTSEHIHDLCGETMRLNMTVIKGSKPQPAKSERDE
jgi:hypothetical protein